MKLSSWTMTALIFVALAGLMVACNGMDSGDFIRIKVPTEVQKALSAPPSVTLNEGRRLAEDWETGGRRLAESLAEGEQQRQLFNSILEFGGSIAIPGLEASVPGGGIVAALAALGLGRFTGNRAAQKQAEAKLAEEQEKLRAKFLEQLGAEKIASYNKGKKDAVALITPDAKGA
jgi:hypothetical protein